MFFRREKFRMLYGRQRAYIERRNYYDESYEELYGQTHYLWGLCEEEVEQEEYEI